jgi:hypothetical protein
MGKIAHAQCQSLRHDVKVTSNIGGEQVGRRLALEDLLGLRTPVHDALRRLGSYPWDSDVALVTFTRSDAERVLAELTEGRVTGELCSEWANALEGRDDVGLEPGSEDLLKDFLFEAANPEITRPLSPAWARQWRARLQLTQ